MASVQFNLLPDVKLDFIKTQRTKHLVTTIALLAAGVAVVIFVLTLATVEGLQKKQLSDTDKDITTASNQLKNTTGLSQILTVQNQLQTLSTLHHSKHVDSRLFGYLTQLTPTNAFVGRLNLDFTANNLEIDGTADSQTTVNTFIDTLKFTTYKIGAQDTAHQAFTSVAESSFSIAANTVDYSLKVTFDPQLFSNDVSATPALTVPKLTTTRSVIEDPSNVLFKDQTVAPTTTKSGGQ